MKHTSPSSIRPLEDGGVGGIGEKNGSDDVGLEGPRESGLDPKMAEREEVEADDGGEKRDVVKMSDPREPSEEERRERNLTHLPFRSWRPRCVRGRGREADHKKLKDRAEGLHELHFDFMFMGQEDQPKQTLTILVVKERRTNMVWPPWYRRRVHADSL